MNCNSTFLKKAMPGVIGGEMQDKVNQMLLLVMNGQAHLDNFRSAVGRR